MMLGVPGLVMPDGPAVAESGGASGGSSGGVEESGGGGGGGGGNRWPRQETLALLKIRSDMDVTFKDASLKGPLWEEVSRKMGELGYQRSAKKCKEKFENVYKYHKRTKDGRASKPDGKTYRFFDQLAALETTPFNQFTPPPPPQRPIPPAATVPPPLNTTMPASHVTVSSSTSPTPLSVAPPKITTNRIINSSPSPSPSPSQPPLIQLAAIPPPPRSPLSNSTSSSTSSDEDIQRRQGKKRKWKDYFEKLLKDVVNKQEELQKKFLETLEKRERDRIAREEAWRVQEMARMNREHDRLMQERSITAAKDAAVIAFLQKVTGENTDVQTPVTNTVAAPPEIIPVAQPKPPPPSAAEKPPPPPQPTVAITPTKVVEALNRDAAVCGGGGDELISPSSSRWPKAEVEALIKLRTGLELKYQDNGPKGPLWEEISKAMAGLGYSRNAKRCKEKWENINKYFKKVKESSKKRPEDSKTCPYFHQLDAIYKQRAKKPESPMVAIMARPEQQWPQAAEQNPTLHDIDSEKNDHDHEQDEEYEDEDEDDDDEVGGYEIIANKQVTNTVE